MYVYASPISRVWELVPGRAESSLTGFWGNEGVHLMEDLIV